MDFVAVKSKVESILENSKNAAFATVNKKGIVSVCNVVIVNDETKVYVQTDEKSEKVTNIKENPNVAINIGAYNLKGVAKVIGHPNTNKVFIEKLKQKHLKTFDKYTNLEQEVLIEIALTEARIWGIEDRQNNNEVLTLVDFINKKTSQIVYNALC